MSQIDVIESVYSLWQMLIVVLTLGVGVAAIGRMVKVGCNNSPGIIAILLCGFIHEVYAIYILKTVQIDEKALNDSCGEFHQVCLIATVLTLLTMSLSAIRTTFSHATWKTSRRVALVYVVVVLPLVIGMKTVGYSGGDEKHLPTMKVKSELIYVTICERDPRKDIIPSAFEFFALHIPFMCLCVSVYRTQKASNEDTSLSAVKCLAPCQEGEPFPYHCRICARLSPVLGFCMLSFTFLLLVVRPILFMSSIVLGTLYKDVLPNVTITVLYTYLAAHCTFDCHWSTKTLTSNNVSKDSLVGTINYKTRTTSASVQIPK